MIYTNETGGILKEEAKKRRGASKAMNIGAHQHSRVRLSIRAGHVMDQVGNPAADAVDGLPYGYPDSMCARIAAGRTRATGRSLVSLERSSGLRSRQSESARGEGLVPGTNRAALAVRFLRTLTADDPREPRTNRRRHHSAPAGSSSRLPPPAGGNRRVGRAPNKTKDRVSGTKCSVTPLRPSLPLAEIHSQILCISVCLIARQVLDHTSFLQELQRPQACKEHRSANYAGGSPAGTTRSALLCTSTP